MSAHIPKEVALSDEAVLAAFSLANVQFGSGEPAAKKVDTSQKPKTTNLFTLVKWAEASWKAKPGNREAYNTLEKASRKGGAPSNAVVKAIDSLGDRALVPILKSIARQGGWLGDNAKAVMKEHRWK